MPSGNKPLPGPILTQNFVAIWRNWLQSVNSGTASSFSKLIVDRKPFYAQAKRNEHEYNGFMMVPAHYGILINHLGTDKICM